MKNLLSRLPNNNEGELSGLAVSMHSSLKGNPRISC